MIEITTDPVMDSAFDAIAIQTQRNPGVEQIRDTLVNYFQIKLERDREEDDKQPVRRVRSSDSFVETLREIGSVGATSAVYELGEFLQRIYGISQNDLVQIYNPANTRISIEEAAGLVHQVKRGQAA